MSDRGRRNRLGWIDARRDEQCLDQLAAHRRLARDRVRLARRGELVAAELPQNRGQSVFELRASILRELSFGSRRTPDANAEYAGQIEDALLGE